jgi:hypothetical protein
MEDVMATAADKKKWDTLHAAYAKASEALLAYEIELGRKYGHNFQAQWLSAGQLNKFEKLSNAKDKIGEKIYELVERISPRRWDQGVPSWWVRQQLTWEDAIRPVGEPLSVVVPGSYGMPDGTVKESRRTKMAEYEDDYEDDEEEDDRDDDGSTNPDDVEFSVDDARGRERIFKTFDEAAGFAVSMAASNGSTVNLDVLIWSPAGARAYGGDDAVEQYFEDPEASVFERIKIKADAVGRVA